MHIFKIAYLPFRSPENVCDLTSYCDQHWSLQDVRTNSVDQNIKNTGRSLVSLVTSHIVRAGVNNQLYRLYKLAPIKNSKETLTCNHKLYMINHMRSVSVATIVTTSKSVKRTTWSRLSRIPAAFYLILHVDKIISFICLIYSITSCRTCALY